MEDSQARLTELAKAEAECWHEIYQVLRIVLPLFTFIAVAMVVWFLVTTI